MSKRTLWGHPRSINVQKVLWALDELGLAYERVDAGGTFGRNRDPEYLVLNPNGLIPTLVDDGEALWESNSIVRYLFARYGQPPIHPAEPIARARADAWTDWGVSTLWASVRPLLVQLVRTPEGERNRALIEQSQVQAESAAKLLERELSHRKYLVGDTFTWGDIPVGAALQRWLHLPIKRPELPALEAYYARIAQRPGFQRWVDLPIA